MYSTLGSFGSIVSNVFTRFSSSKYNASLTETGRQNTSPDITVETPPKNERGQGMALKLKFHPVHGKALTLHEHARSATRDKHYFEHGVLFSRRPIAVNESVAIQITEMTDEFRGPLRIGFTSINPNTFIDERTDCHITKVPLGMDLKNMRGVWIKGVHLFRLEVGSTVYWKVTHDGCILHGVDGENGGIFLREVNTSVPLWAVVEVYGFVKGVKFVNKTMILTREDEHSKGISEVYQSPNLEKTRHPSRPNLFTRRNAVLSSLPCFNKISIPSSLVSPVTPAFVSPIPFDDADHGLCIMCFEKVKNTAFNHCGHICMCDRCAKRYCNKRTAENERQRCPVCRGTITSILKLYH